MIQLKSQHTRSQTVPTGPSAETTLHLDAVTKTYGSVIAAEDVSLEVAQGEFVTLLGPSGSGKTTTLNLVAGFERPDRGRVLIDGSDVTRLPPNKRNLGMVLQGYALFPHMTVRENVAFPLRARHYRGSHTKAVDEALEIVSLDGYGDRRPRELSGGQQQRVALARSFVNRPPVLLMDEPLSALDRALRTRMQSELRRIHREIGTTVVYVTHDQEEAMSLSDRVVIMHEARVVQVGTPRAIYTCPSTPFVAQFIGKASTIPVQLQPTVAGNAFESGRCPDGSRIDGRRTGGTSGPAQGIAVLRPEDARLGRPEDPRSSNTFEVRVREKVFLGDKIVCTGTFGSGEACEFWLPHEQDGDVRLGTPLTVSWRKEQTALVQV
jgi:putative spermidine/putrescine transport system ATP-binding protein